jgi:hypothetical protein
VPDRLLPTADAASADGAGLTAPALILLVWATAALLAALSWPAYLLLRRLRRGKPKPPAPPPPNADPPAQGLPRPVVQPHVETP